jgi:hypothetical protein
MQKSELLREKKRLLCLTPLHYAINKVKDERGRVRGEECEVVRGGIAVFLCAFLIP